MSIIMHIVCLQQSMGPMNINTKMSEEKYMHSYIYMCCILAKLHWITGTTDVLFFRN